MERYKRFSQDFTPAVALHITADHENKAKGLLSAFAVDGARLVGMLTLHSCFFHRQFGTS
jgi:hypothetical protein